MTSRTRTNTDRFSAPVDSLASLVHLLRWRAVDQPGRLAYTFLPDGETEEARLTYKDLDRQARAVAAALQSMAASGERALLVFPAGSEFVAAFFGCLYAGVIAVPAYPPDPSRLSRTLPRFRAIANDARPAVALTTSTLLPLIEKLGAQCPDLQSIRWLTTDDISVEVEPEWKEPSLTDSTIAFLQYTSGSTSRPRGVMVSHGNLMHNERMIKQACRHSEISTFVSWLPLYHDMGLIGTVLQPLYLGTTSIIMPPVAFLQRPFRWLQAISRYKAATSGGPNFAYDLCVRKVTPAERASLDLSSWTTAFNGAEPVRPETLDRFASAFADSGFRREAFFVCYGLAESTLIVCGSPREIPPTVYTIRPAELENNRVVPACAEGEAARSLVSCGHTLLGQRVVIVNPEDLTECPPDKVGEIWVSGKSVAAGYWNRPEETEQTFNAHLADTREGPYLRTGDMGFLRDGEVFITGRLKDLIIIRGRNHYPQDVEWTVESSHKSLRQGCGAAFSIEATGEERLIVVQEVDDKQPPDVGEIIRAIRREVAENHELQVYSVVLIKPGSIPKTSSGKIQRQFCRDALLKDDLDVLSRWQESLESEAQGPPPAISQPDSVKAIQAWLVARLASGLRVDPSSIAVDEALTHYGLDSLLTIELVHTIEASLGVVLPSASLLQGLTITQIADQAFHQMTTGDNGTMPVVAEAGKRVDQYPLSYGQRALWFLYRLAPDAVAYNVSAAARIAANLDARALRRAFQSLVDRHPSLRSIFSAPDGEPLQRINEFVDVCFQEEDASTFGEAMIEKRLVEEAHRPFDLEQCPLLRVTLFRRSAQEHILLLVVHHIVVDLWSLGILLKELDALYEAEKNGASAGLAPLKLQYTDYIHWQAEMLGGSEGERSWEYWQERLAGDLPILNLPTDRPRPAVQAYRGASQSFRLSAELTEGLKALSRTHEATLYMLLLAAFQVLLHRYSGEEDILVGSPATGRTRADFRNVVGYFVNPLILRADLSADPTFDSFIDSVRQTVLSALNHQDYPFNLLVERLQPDRDPSRPPLFQVMFALHQDSSLGKQGLASFALGEEGAEIKMGSLLLDSIPLQQRVAQFDLTLAMAEADGGLTGSLQYNTDLFDSGTITRIIESFKCLLGAVTTAPQQQVSELPVVTESERHLLAEWNQRSVDYPDNHCIHQLFEDQAEKSAEAVAVILDDERLSYSELNRRANQLAYRLRALGVGPEVSVGVCMHQSLEMVVALLAVLKAGGVYVPLDPQYPRERLAFMIKDSQMHVLLTERIHATRLPPDALPPEVVFLDLDRDAITHESDANLHNLADPDNLAYMIYTSGSTGRPKGVCLSHRTAVNHFFVARSEYSLCSSDVVLQFASPSFDVSLEQLLPALFIGASVVLRGAEVWSTTDFIRKISELGLTVINPATAYWHQLIKDRAADQEGIPNSRLRLVIAGGDAMLPESARLWQQSGLSSARLLNGYGPTETAITAAAFEVPRGFSEESPSRRIPIGRPLENRTLRILDKRGNLVPTGVVGELHIGGDLLARGYFNRPDLTAERFIPDHFTDRPGARLYKTGDLARYLADGNIEFLGRVDCQVKVRGFRIELGEIEAALSRCDSVRECVIVAREDEPGDKRLVAYVVGEENKSITTTEMRRFLIESLPDYMVPSRFVLLKALPLTPNGKLDRRALPLPDWSMSDLADDFAAPHTPVEEILCIIWSQVLGVERLSIRDNFFEMGGHSLLAIKVVSRVQDALHVELPVGSLFESPTIEGLAAKIDAAMRDGQARLLPPIEPVPREGAVPLSFAQQRLWLLHQFAPGSPVYNIPFLIRLKGQLDLGALKQSIREIFARHEALRATFITVDGLPWQVINPAPRLSVPLTDLTGMAEGEREALAIGLAAEESRQPFDLGQGPLLRARLLRLTSEDHMAVITTHHIASDGWSTEILARELAALYRYFSGQDSFSLPDLPIQYTDYVHWQREWSGDGAFQTQLEYWKRQLAAAPPILELPADRPRPAAQTYEGAVETFKLEGEVSRLLKELSRANGVTLFMTLIAAFKVLLYRYSRQPDVIIGTPIANRNRVEIEPLIGSFSNMLVLRTDMGGDADILDALKRVRDVALGAYAHQDLPLEKLVEELHPERSLSHTPLFQVVLALHDDPLRCVEIPGMALSHVPVHTGTSKFDLLMNVWEEGGHLVGALEYSTELFHANTIKRMVGSFTTLLEAIAVNPRLPVSALPLLTRSEQKQLLAWNNSPRRYQQQSCLHQLFEAQVERTPEATAVVFERDRLTYRDLNRRANQLARHLQSLGVGPEVCVAICVERSIEMLVGMLGILKAGGAYVPLDPAYPKERLAYILEDTRAPVLVTQREMIGVLPAQTATEVDIHSTWDSGRELAGQESEANLDIGMSAESPAYVIYTSGSTGRPKGVVVTHSNVSRLFEATRSWFEPGEKDVWTLFHSYAFDFSVWETWGPLLHGGRLVVVPYMTSRTPEAFYELLVSEKVTVLNQTPSAFRQLIQAEERLGRQNELSLNLVIFGGEALELQSLKPWFERHGDKKPQLINMYGITETTVHVTYRPLKESDLSSGVGSVIGEAIPDLQLVVLDEHLQPVPVGVAGEIYVGGAGLARGYLNRPELTAERFIPNPYSESEGSRLYKTGDLARYLENGELEYLGRADHQVKVRGYRIELAEIEAAIMEHSAIRESVVTAREDAGGEKRLVAYIVTTEKENLTASEMRACLKEKLPDYMVPTAFVMMETLPLTANGKVDRHALPAPDSQRPALESPYIDPHTEMEKIISTVWRQLLRVDKVGVNDNFFDLGGDSFLMAQACSRLREALDRDISMVEAFTYASVSTLAKHLSQAQPAAAIQRQSDSQVETRRESQKRREQLRKQLRIKDKI